jgi:hypothetical protein
MAGNHPNNKTPGRAKESALSRAFTSTLLRFRHTERSISFSPLICPAALSPLHLFSSGHLGTAAISAALLAMCSGVPLSAEDGGFLFLRFLLAIFGGSAEANSRQAFCNLAPIWHQNPVLEWVFSGMAKC